MFSFFKRIFKQGNYDLLVQQINELEPEVEKLSNEELKAKSLKLKDRVEDGDGLDDVLPEAFALAREAAKRTLGQRHFDVQLMGGIVLHQGKIAEMLTGEGKTLAATAPAYLNALAGRGVHIITVNDYLARRDTVWMGQIYDALGLSVGCLAHDAAYLYDPKYNKEISNSQFPISKQIPNSKSQIQNDQDRERDIIGGFKVVQEYLRPVSRKEAYLAHITYGTNHEFGFDYLRDNLAYDLNAMVQIRDGKVHNFAIVDEVDSILIDEARTPLIIAAPDTESSAFYRIMSRAVENLHPEEDYIVDEKSRHAAITDEGINKIEKLLKIENLYAPENSRLVHYLEESLKAKALFHRDKNYVVKGGEVIIVDEFTGRLMHGRRYSGGLHQAIEAKEDVPIKQESRTFAQITIQNYFRLYEKMAGMTGTAQTSAEEFDKVYKLEVASIPPNRPMIREDTTDLIYKTMEAKYQAVLDDVRERNRAGQPVLIGTASIARNELLSKLLGQAGIPHEVLNAKNHEREGAIIAQAGRFGAVTVATNMAGRGVDIILGGYPPSKSEIRNTKSPPDFAWTKSRRAGETRNEDDEYKKWQKEQQKVKELGGLHVIGTERHEARRIDNQLRGRSGRQGDPGSSRFFLSLEDDLLRIFGGERIKSLMNSFNLPDNEPIESNLVSKVVNEAQRKIEGFNFDVRKHLLEYDDILNKQRAAFYRKRQEILDTAQTNADYTQTNADQDADQRGLTTQINADDTRIDADSIGVNQRINQRQSAIGSPRESALMMLDILWMNYLEEIEALRESVGMRAYGQHEPLVEFRRESHILFQQLLQNFDLWLNQNVELLKENSKSPPAPRLWRAGEIRNSKPRIAEQGSLRGRQIQNANNQDAKQFGNWKLEIGNSHQKVGRNAPCPCGSGKKFKKCHGQ